MLTLVKLCVSALMVFSDGSDDVKQLNGSYDLNVKSNVNNLIFIHTIEVRAMCWVNGFTFISSYIIAF